MSARSLAIGTGLVVLINTGALYSMYQFHSSDWAIGCLPLSVVFFFMLVVLNLALRRLWAAAALDRTELIAIFLMALVGASVPKWGTASCLMSVIAAPFLHLTSPENQWADFLQPHLRRWLVPTPGRHLPRFLRQSLFWFGFGLPVFIVLWNAVAHFSPTFPAILTDWDMALIGPVFSSFALHVNFALVGFTFFIHREVAASSSGAGTPLAGPAGGVVPKRSVAGGVLSGAWDSQGDVSVVEGGVGSTGWGSQGEDGGEGGASRGGWCSGWTGWGEGCAGA